MDYNARYYSLVLGRFVSPDTIVPESGSSGGFNRYRYVRNNPLRYTDPSGHCVGVALGADTLACVAVGKLVVDAIAIGVAAYLIVDTAQDISENVEGFPLGNFNEPLPGYGEGELLRPDPYQLPPTTLDVPETELQLPPYGGQQSEQPSAILDFPLDSGSDLSLTIVSMAIIQGPNIKDLRRQMIDRGGKLFDPRQRQVVNVESEGFQRFIEDDLGRVFDPSIYKKVMETWIFTDEMTGDPDFEGVHYWLNTETGETWFHD